MSILDAICHRLVLFPAGSLRKAFALAASQESDHPERCRLRARGGPGPRHHWTQRRRKDDHGAGAYRHLAGADQNASTEAQRDLRAVDARISELSERKLAIEDRLSRTEIRSPVSGYVNELFVHTVGGVITPAAKIATIVPQKAELKFEIRVSPADIDQVREGQPARVRLTAFNRTTTPEMKGRVTMVSPASARDPANGQEHYIAYVNLLPTEAAIVQQNGMTLVPGMPAEVFVSTQERTVASYLSKPFTDQMNRAFRER